MKKEVFYPPVGIAHITNDLIDLILYKYKNQKQIIINTSAQPNSSPHLGTITTIMSAFALAEHIKRKLNVDVIVQFDELENSPAKFFEFDGEIFYKDQKHTYNTNGTTNEYVNMQKFNEIMQIISRLSSIDYKVRSYNQFQKNKYVRKALIDIINDKNYFEELLFPSSKNLHIRTICPICGLGRKNDYLLKESHDLKSLVLNDKCPIHGNYETYVTQYNVSYVDINTQFRDLTKGVAMLKEDAKNNTLTIMIDGGDWAGIWSQRIHTEGLIRLGFLNFPIRFFAPIILDWSGAKFSKSLYLKNDAYKNINKAFINYDNFIKYYGLNGINILWQEVKDWISEPKKFFRNYSIEYFEEIMEKKYEN